MSPSRCRADVSIMARRCRVLMWSLSGRIEAGIEQLEFPGDGCAPSPSWWLAVVKRLPSCAQEVLGDIAFEGRPVLPFVRLEIELVLARPGSDFRPGCRWTRHPS